jgi:hypothetical protein
MTKDDRLRDELMGLRRWQNAEGYDYDADIECRIKAIIRERAQLARRRASNRVYRETMFDLNGHHGRA